MRKRSQDVTKCHRFSSNGFLHSKSFPQKIQKTLNNAGRPSSLGSSIDTVPTAVTFLVLRFRSATLTRPSPFAATNFVSVPAYLPYFVSPWNSAFGASSHARFSMCYTSFPISAFVPHVSFFGAPDFRAFSSGCRSADSVPGPIGRTYFVFRASFGSHVRRI